VSSFRDFSPGALHDQPDLAILNPFEVTMPIEARAEFPASSFRSRDPPKPNSVFVWILQS
jgi:hypothetical protein